MGIKAPHSEFLVYRDKDRDGNGKESKKYLKAV
jgi:hypothetical protein